MEQYEDIISKRANFGIRFGAFILDAIIFFALGYLFKMILGQKDPTPEEMMGLQMSEIMMLTTSASMVTYIIGLLYFLTEVFLLKTPGKMILGLVVADQEGNKPPMNALIIRYLFKQGATLVIIVAVFANLSALLWFSYLLSLIYLVSCLMATRETRLALHDDIAKTAVFKEKMLLEVI
jgi:uncharacterized RDD family membrane protein YckC